MTLSVLLMTCMYHHQSCPRRTTVLARWQDDSQRIPRGKVVLRAVRNFNMHKKVENVRIDGLHAPSPHADARKTRNRDSTLNDGRIEPFSRPSSFIPTNTPHISVDTSEAHYVYQPLEACHKRGVQYPPGRQGLSTFSPASWSTFARRVRLSCWTRAARSPLISCG
jgi:hypothetical protein